MKRLLLLAPIAALALASCSNDEQIAQSPALNAQELTFRPAVNGTTRTVITDANFDGFHVYAKIKDGTSYAFWPIQVNTTDPEHPVYSDPDAGEGNHEGAVTTLDFDVTKTDGKWQTINGKKWFWSSKNAEASFRAYNESGTITVPNDVLVQKDVLVAYNEGVASSFDNGVPLLFRHVMSQIVIKADNKDADIRQIKVAAVRLHNIANKNTLNTTGLTTPTTADKFKWYNGTEGYNPWESAPTSTNDVQPYYYYKGTGAAPNAGTVSDFITLNPTAQDITFDGPALLLPQTKTAATDLTTPAANGAYIDVLVQVQDLEEIAKLSSTDQTIKDSYSDNDAAIFPKINVVTTANPTPNETLINQKFAWVAVPVDIAWKPGYKYTYVLHFSKDGIGKVSPDEEGGNPDPGPQPGEEIVDNPVPLYFTVVIDEWNNADNTEKDL